MAEINEQPVLEEEENGDPLASSRLKVLPRKHVSSYSLEKERGVRYLKEALMKDGVSPGSWKLLPRWDKDTSIQRIIIDALDNQITASTSFSRNLFGTAPRIEELEWLQNLASFHKVSVVGIIWGIPGIGETSTIAKVVFERITGEFDAGGFVPIIAETVRNIDLASAMSQVLVVLDAPLRNRTLAVLHFAGNAERLELSVAVSDHWFECIPAEPSQLEPLQVPDVSSYLNVSFNDLQTELSDEIFQNETTLSHIGESSEQRPVVEINEHPPEKEETGTPLSGYPNEFLNDLQAKLQDRIFQHETFPSPVGGSLEQGFIIEINEYPPEVDTGTPLANEQKDMEMIEITFITAMLAVEAASASFEQLQQPELSLVMAALGVLLCLVEIIYKGKMERVKFEHRSFLPWFYIEYPEIKLFGTTNLYLGLLATIWQMVHSAMGLIYTHKHPHNPIQMTIIMVLFCGCQLMEQFVNKEIERIELLLLIAMVVMEVTSTSFEQRFAKLALVTAIFGLLLCLIEIIYKGKKERAKFECTSFLPWFYSRHPKHKLFGTINLYFGLLVAIWQVVHSAISYIYTRKHPCNPIQMTNIMAMFRLCQLIGKLLNKFCKLKPTKLQGVVV